MKRILLMLIIIFSFNVYADVCKNDELKKLKNIASQVELTYEYDVKSKIISGKEYYYNDYTVIATNITKELKVNYEIDFFNGNYKEFKVENGIGRLSGFEDGENVTVTIRAYTNDECSGKVLLTKTIKMPYANPMYYYYNNCNDYPDFKYCHPIVDKKITNELFLEEFYKYLGNNTTSDNSSDVNYESDKGINNYIIISIVLIIITLFVIISIIIVKKRKKNSL